MLCIKLPEICFENFPQVLGLKLEVKNLDKNRAEQPKTGRIFKGYGLIINFYSYILVLKNRYHFLLCTCVAEEANFRNF